MSGFFSSSGTFNQTVQLSEAASVNLRTESTSTINLPAGTQVTFDANALEGQGSISINGTLIAASPTTGPSTGTAAAGTTSTQLVKDAGVAWTSSDLRATLLRVTSGPASGEIRQILDNAAHSASFYAIPGFEEGHTWELLDYGTIITSMTLRRNTPTLMFTGCSIGSIVSEDNLDIQFNGCRLSIESSKDRSLSISNSENSGSTIVNDAEVVSALNCVGDDVAWQFNRCGHVVTDIDVQNASATPILFNQVRSVEVGANSNDNTGDGVEFRSCSRVDLYGSGLTGSSNTGYGARFGGGGYYVMDGATITGDINDLIVEEFATTWSTLSTNETIIEKGTSVLVLGG